MNAKTITMGIVGITVAVLITMSVAVPILSESVKTEDTFTNEGYYRLSEINEDTDVTISWDHTEPKKLTVNDDVINLSTPGVYNAVSIVATDHFVVRFIEENNGYKIQKFGAGGFATAGTVAETDATIVINGYSCTVTLGTNELSDEVITQGYYADNNGNMIMKNANKGAYIKPDDSVICLAGVSNIGGTDVTIYAPGTIEDGLEFTVLSGVAGTTYSIGDPVFNYTTVDSYIDLNLLTKVVFDFTRGATTQTVTYSYFIVPYEVTAERSVHPSANTIEMLEIIPIMVLIGIVLATIGLVMFKRNQ